MSTQPNYTTLTDVIEVLRSARRLPIAQARSSRCFRPGPSTASPASMAYWTSRIRCARQT